MGHLMLITRASAPNPEFKKKTQKQSETAFTKSDTWVLKRQRLTTQLNNELCCLVLSRLIGASH